MWLKLSHLFPQQGVRLCKIDGCAKALCDIVCGESSWNWYEKVNLLVSAFRSPNAPYASLSGTFFYQFVPSFTVHPPLFLGWKLKSYNKMAIYPPELMDTPCCKALSVSPRGALRPHWAPRHEAISQMEREKCSDQPFFPLSTHLRSKPIIHMGFITLLEGIRAGGK